MTSKSMADLFLESTKPQETKKHYVNTIKALHYLCSFWHIIYIKELFIMCTTS